MTAVDRALFTAAVVASLALAGCGGFAGGGDPGIDETVTPAPVPTTTGSPTPAGELAPGVERDDVDEDDVALAHDSELTDRSYTLERTVRWETANGTVYRGSTVQRVGHGWNRYALTEEYTRPHGGANRTGFDAFFDGRRTLVQARFHSGPAEYAAFDRPLHRPEGATPLVERLFDDVDVERVSETDGGAVVVRGQVDEPTVLASPRGASGGDNGSMTARIDSTGYVDGIAVGYEATVDGEAVTVRSRMRITEVGNTTVRGPEWAAAARENASVDDE